MDFLRFIGIFRQVDTNNPFGEVAGRVGDTIFSGLLWFGLAAILVLVVLGVMWYFIAYQRKFDIKVLVKSDRAGLPTLVQDKAAILDDRKTGTKFLKLWNLKKSLPIPPYNILQKSNKGDIVEMWRKSEDEFTFLTPGRIDKTRVLKQDGRLYPVSQIEQKQVEGDISYWNVKRKKDNKNLFSPDSVLMKLIPFIPQLLGGVFLIFVLYLFLDSLPGILTELQALTRELRSLKTAELTTGFIWTLLP